MSDAKKIDIVEFLLCMFPMIIVPPRFWFTKLTALAVIRNQKVVIC